MVQHQGRDGEKHLYSSKPPLLATLMAVPYWVIYHSTGATLAEHPYEIGRGLLMLYNVPLLIVYFLIVAALAERFGTTDWGRLFMMAAAIGGTFLTTFAVSVNNHLPAAVAAAATLLAATRILLDGRAALALVRTGRICRGFRVRLRIAGFVAVRPGDGLAPLESSETDATGLLAGGLGRDHRAVCDELHCPR